MATVAFGYHLDSPATAPAVAQGSHTGNLSGIYQYAITFMGVYGETLPGPPSLPITISYGTSAELTNIPIGAGAVLARRVYRTAGGGSQLKYVATINDNVTTSYTDKLADGSLGCATPLVNSANSMQVINGFTAFSEPIIVSAAMEVAAAAPGETRPILTAQINVVTSCGPNGQVMMTPINRSLISVEITVANNGKNPLLIVAAPGQTINGGPTFALAEGASADFVAANAANWLQIR